MLIATSLSLHEALSGVAGTISIASWAFFLVILKDVVGPQPLANLYLPRFPSWSRIISLKAQRASLLHFFSSGSLASNITLIIEAFAENS